MATRLKNIVNFVNVAPAATVILPHGLNIDGRPARPDFVAPSVAGFNVTVDATNVTVTNTNPNISSIDVICECWHTIERAFGDAADLELAPRPFILSPGGTAGGNPINVEEEGALVGVRPTLNFIGGAVTATDDIPNSRVNVTITAAALTGNPPTQIDSGDAAAVGVSADAARADHQHALPAPAAPPSTASANAAGVSTAVAREDHTHVGTVAIQEEGVLVAREPIINFIGALVTAAPGVGKVDVTIATPADADTTLLTWGNSNIGAAADTRYLSPGRDNSAIALVTELAAIPLPRAGTLRRLYVRHNAATGNGNSVVYTVMVNGVATGITVTVPTGAVGQVADLVNAVAVVAGDRVSIQLAKALGVGGGGEEVQATLEIGY